MRLLIVAKAPETRPPEAFTTILLVPPSGARARDAATTPLTAAFEVRAPVCQNHVFVDWIIYHIKFYNYCFLKQQC